MPREDRERYDFSKLKLNGGNLNNPTYVEGSLSKSNKGYKKDDVLDAIERANREKLVDISNYFYRTSGIYQRLCRYMAYMYRYDWLITPYFSEKTSAEETKLLKAFNDALVYFDNFDVKRFFGETALKVVKTGCFYGYWSDASDQPQIQELPASYCRSRFKTADGRPVVEFYAKYFDDAFKSTEQREKMLAIFPPEFKKGYKAYKKGKLSPQFQGDVEGWFLLDPIHAIKFNINGEDFPIMISVIPLLLDLDDMQELEKKKAEQQLLKIIVQKFPLDKNNDLVFDPDEMTELHKAAVNMIGKSVGLNVLTTVADVDVADVADKKTNAVNDTLEKMERSVFNAAGVSQMQFNTSGNLALEKSILNDEASMMNLIQQFEKFLNVILSTKFNKKKKAYLKAQLLGTTIYNYKDLAKLYKEMTELGYSKVLPQIALGQAQSFVYATAYFENEVLSLTEKFIPPMSSNTMSADAMKNSSDSDSSKQQKTTTKKSEGGRPTKESQGESVSDKTIQNKESAS